jgi:protein TonB
MVENGPPYPMPNTRTIHRQRIFIVTSVLLLHVLALWALQTGLLQRVLVLAEEIVVPVEFITPVTPPVVKPPPVLPKPPPSTKTPVAAPSPSPVQPVAPAPVPLAIADTTPSATAPVGVTHAPATVAPVAPVPSAPAPAPKVELPITDVEYLHKTEPKYPKLSERRNEHGTVIVHVFVGVDGRVRDVSVKATSGYERLDRAAREAVLEWIFGPRKRNGIAVEWDADLSVKFEPRSSLQ